MEILEKGMEILKKIPKEYYLPILFGCAGLILFVYGFVNVLVKNQLRENSAASDFSQAHSSTNSAQLKPLNTIKVDVEGAVVNPGVYSVAADSRIQDGLIAAGGLSGNADRDWVNKHINLALKLIDGTKIYIPSYAEASAFVDTSADKSVGQANSFGEVLGAQSQQIDINSASASDLDSLPGVGTATVQKIIDGRPYSSTQDLLNNKIVGAKEFEKIKTLIVAQ